MPVLCGCHYGVNGGVCSRNILARLETKHKLSGRTDHTILPQPKTLISYTKLTHTIVLAYLLAADQIFSKYAISVFLSLQ